MNNFAICIFLAVVVIIGLALKEPEPPNKARLCDQAMTQANSDPSAYNMHKMNEACK